MSFVADLRLSFVACRHVGYSLMANGHTYYLIIRYSITDSLFYSRLKTFLFCKSFPPQPFLVLLQDSLHGFPRLFTVISEHAFFLLLFSFSVFALFNCRFRAVD